MRAFRQASALVGGALSTLALPVFAEVPTEVTAAVTAMGVDAKVVATAVLVAIIIVAAVKFIRRGI